ncbi:hypothetical protein H6G27_24155 [Nostoc linckia FACHB-104]|nr:hypothetical protein [Nostoc linckia FACHB-104]
MKKVNVAVTKRYQTVPMCASFIPQGFQWNVHWLRGLRPKGRPITRPGSWYRAQYQLPEGDIKEKT